MILSGSLARNRNCSLMMVHMKPISRIAAVASVALAVVLPLPAHAIEITDEASCQSELKAIKGLDDHSDAGPKFEPIIKDLIEVLEHLCEQKDFGHADDVADALRVILAHRRTG